MRIGLVGLPNVGKSSIFNLLTNAGARVDSFPFTTIEKNTGVVLVPDARLERIRELLKPEKLTPAHIEFVDIAGLVKGASQGEGLGNKFLAHVRETSLMLHVLRAFDSGIAHPLGAIDPMRDLEIVESELAIADLEVVEHRLQTLVKESRTPEHEILLHALHKMQHSLGSGLVAPALSPEERASLRSFGLFSLKPVVFVVNCSEDDPTDVAPWTALRNKDVFLVSAALETEAKDFPDSEKRELRKSLGLAESGPAGIVEHCLERLGLIRFYTVKGAESRAWAIEQGTSIVDAAGRIHTTMAEGFIKAEVLAYDDLVASGDFPAAREHGKVRVEGKNYVVKDGDVILIKFRT
jgi:GTP-binding protein YchF